MDIFSTNSDFNVSILKREYFLDSTQVSKEQLALLSSLIQLSLASEKKRLSSYANARIAFQVKTYGTGYIFSIAIEQTQAKGLKYIFQNPYKKALNLLTSLSFTLLEDEKSLALAKEKTIASQHQLFSFSPSKFLISSLGYGPIAVDKNILMTLKIEKVKEAFSLLKNSSKGLNISYSAPKGINLPAFKTSLTPFKSELPEKTEFTNSSLEKEAFLSLYSLKKPLKDENEYRQFLFASSLLENYTKQVLQVSFGSKIDFSFLILDDSHVAITGEFEKGKKQALQEKMTSLVNRLSPQQNEEFLSNAKSDFLQCELKREIDLETKIDHLTFLAENSLPLTNSSEGIDYDKGFELLENLQFEKVYYALCSKEVQHA